MRNVKAVVTYIIAPEERSVIEDGGGRRIIVVSCKNGSTRLDGDGLCHSKPVKDFIRAVRNDLKGDDDGDSSTYDD